MPNDQPEWATIKPIFRHVESNIKLTQYRPCPICGFDTYTGILRLENFQFFSDIPDKPKQADICTVQCNHCYALYMNPVYTPEGFSLLFAEAGESYGSSLGRIPEQITWLKTKDQLTPRRVVLDLGCHHGDFLACLPDNLKLIGIDLDEKSINYAQVCKQNKHIEFLASDFKEPFPVTPGCLITLLHVLEHLPDPSEILMHLSTQIDADTRLFIEVPLLENGRTNDINGFLSVTHLTHFSRATLHNCIEQSGWKIIDWDEQQGYNGCRVLAMPAPVDAPTNATKKLNTSENDMRETHAYLEHWQHSVQSAVTKLNPALDSDRCIIWGAGLHTEFLYQLTALFKSDSCKQFILLDNDQEKQGKCWRGISIQPPSILEHPSLVDVPVIISTYRNQEAIVTAIKRCRGHDSAIIRLYDYIRSY